MISGIAFLNRSATSSLCAGWNRDESDTKSPNRMIEERDAGKKPWPSSPLWRERQNAKELVAYEYAHHCRYHLDRKGIPVPWSGLELSHGPRLRWKRSFLDAIPCPMARFRATGRKRDPSLVLVLEHRGKRPHVHLFHFPTGSHWHPGLPSKLAHLHSQFDADPETQVRFHRCRAVATPTRNRLSL